MRTIKIKGRKRLVKELFSISEKVIIWSAAAAFVLLLLLYFIILNL
jgi:hypothetical protein